SVRRAPAPLVRGGLWVLVPGGAQWWWGQRERASVFFGTFSAALVVGLFTWGTSASAAILLFAFAAHVASAADAIRQGAFPGFGRPGPGLLRPGPGDGLAAGLAGPEGGRAPRGLPGQSVGLPGRRAELGAVDLVRVARRQGPRRRPGPGRAGPGGRLVGWPASR